MSMSRPFLVSYFNGNEFNVYFAGKQNCSWISFFIYLVYKIYVTEFLNIYITPMLIFKKFKNRFDLELLLQFLLNRIIKSIFLKDDLSCNAFSCFDFLE